MPTWQATLDEAVRPENAPEDLGHTASIFLGLLYTDPQWGVVQQELKHIARDNSIDGILQRQEEALLGIRNTASRTEPDPEFIAAVWEKRMDAERSLAAELRAAEADLMANVSELAEQFPEIVEAAQLIVQEAPIVKAASRIAERARAELSRLGPHWPLVVLWWLLVMQSAKDLAALTLFYIVANDYFNKQE